MMTFGAARDAAAALRVHHVSALPRNWGARDGPAGRKRSLAPCQSQWLGSWLHRRAWGGIARRQAINPRAVDYVPQYVSGRMLRPTEAPKVTHVRGRPCTLRPRHDILDARHFWPTRGALPDSMELDGQVSCGNGERPQKCKRCAPRTKR